MIYNIHYDVCAMVISVFSIIFILIKKGFRRKQNVMLFGMFVMAFLAAFFDIFSAVCNSYAESFSDAARDFFNYGYLAIQNLLIYSFFIYVMSLTGLDYKNRNNRKLQLIVTIPFLIDLLLLCLNPFMREVFYYDLDKVYTHGWGMNVLYAVAFLYMFLCYYVINKYGKSVSTGKKVMVYAFLFVSLCAVIVQIFVPHILLQLCIESLCLLGVLFTVDNEDEIIDYITSCYNRRAFIYDNALYIKNNINYYVITVKLPNLNYYSATVGIVSINGFMRKIGEWFRKTDSSATVYYCDNGHFSILCNDEKTMNDVQSRIIRRFNDNWVSGGLMIQFRIQLWCANIPKDIQTLEHLLLIIDAPAQESGLQNGREILADEEIYGYKREIAVEAAIERAIKAKSFQVYYQPIWNAKADKITSAEALLRLYDDELGFIPPDEFIPLAEKKGYIIDIGEFVFESVCRFVKEKQLEEIGIEYIEVNLSPIQCMSENLVDRFGGIIQKYGIKSSNINFEITETAMSNSMEVLESTMEQLTANGFAFSIDDYGTGYSNYNYIFDMPFSIVKLDKSILWKAVENEKANIILTNTVRMVHDMNMKTVVEGVETAEQKNMLQNIGCDYLQGFYFSKAVPEEEFYIYCREFNLK